MFAPEIVQIMAQLREIDKTLQLLYEQCKQLKEENERLKSNNQSTD